MLEEEPVLKGCPAHRVQDQTLHGEQPVVIGDVAAHAKELTEFGSVLDGAFAHDVAVVTLAVGTLDRSCGI